jgi:homoserine kinase type II
MAVFTSLCREDVVRLLAHYSLGELDHFEGIAAGIENSNFFVDTDGGRWVLTIFERLTFKQLPFYLELMRHLARAGLPIPAPQENRAGGLLSELRGKPAAIVTRLAGQWERAPTPAHCAQFGTLIAQMHLAARDFAAFQPNLRGIGWWKSTLPKLRTCPTSSSRGWPRRSSTRTVSSATRRSRSCLPVRCTPTCFATTCCGSSRMASRRWAA